MDIKLPKLGEGADSGSVVSILVKPGDRVKKGQTLIELENEKAVAPIPSPAAGIVSSVRVKEGDRISVGQVIVQVTADGESGGAPAPKAPAAPARPAVSSGAEAPQPVQPSAAAVAEVDEDETEPGVGSALAGLAYDSAVARELGLDLRRVRGSDPGGRVVMADLKGYIQRLERLAAQAKAAAPAAAPVKPAAPSIDFSQWGPVVRKPMVPLRQTIARRMTESWNNIPHVHQFDEVDITDLEELRRKFTPAYEQKGVRLTLTSFVLVALLRALREHPVFNASLDEATDSVVYKEYFNFGLAVDTEAGLFVPVLRHVERKSLIELSREISELAKKARERTLSLDEMKGGTFTISNQGGLGGGAFTPIINRPEVAILGLGRAALKPAVRSGRIEPRLIMPLCVGYDHRLIDGGSAARFIVDLGKALAGINETDAKAE